MKAITAHLRGGTIRAIAWRLILMAVTIAILLSPAAIPDKLIGLYAAVALWIKLESQWSFGLALAFLVTIPLLGLSNLGSIQQSFAVYAFYFLVIGVLQILAENARTSDPESKVRSTSTFKMPSALPAITKPLTPKPVIGHPVHDQSHSAVVPLRRKSIDGFYQAKQKSPKLVAKPPASKGLPHLVNLQSAYTKTYREQNRKQQAATKFPRQSIDGMMRRPPQRG